MDTAIINTIISSIVSLIVAFGTWHISMKKDREKQTVEVMDLLNKHREEYLSGIREVQDDITGVNANIQTQITVIDLRITELKEQVEKHNQVIDRTYKLEQQAALNDNRITHLEQQIGNK